MTLKEALKLKYEVTLTPDGGFWVASIKELPGCITQGNTQIKAIERLKEAKEIWIKEMYKRDVKIELPKDYIE